MRPLAAQRSWVAAGFSALALAVTAWWALKPLPTPDLYLPSISATPSAPATEQLAALDASAFSTPLWVAPPAPPPTPAPAPPPPPLKVQLIAIARDSEGRPAAFSALVYDPDTDRLLTLKQGDRLAGRVIERITALSVELREGNSLRTLALADAQPSSVAGSRGDGQ